MGDERFSRTALMLGGEAVQRLQESRVLLIGLGGVGGYACEALARAGVGTLWLVDHDIVSESNINRQILADSTTVGRPKVEVAAERVARIHPGAHVVARQQFLEEVDLPHLLEEAKPQYIIDAIDTVTSKVALIRQATRQGVPIVSCMGTGNKLYPERLQIGDLAHTHTCPLARAMRARLRAEGVLHVDVLWSDEAPRAPLCPIQENGRHIPASISYVPAVAGLMLAGYVIRRLSGVDPMPAAPGEA